MDIRSMARMGALLLVLAIGPGTGPALAWQASPVATDVVLARPELLERAWLLMLEVRAGAAAFGLDIPESFLRRQIEVTHPMGAYKPSSLVDYLAGRSVEVEAIWGEPLRRAQAAGVAMPNLAALYEDLRVLTARLS